MDVRLLVGSAVAALGFGLAVAIADSAGGANTVASTTTFTADSQFTVPADVTSIAILAVGGKGGTQNGHAGGFGAVASTTVAVTPGDVLLIKVGGNAGAQPISGANGGGYGGYYPGGGGAGGGGASDVRTSAGTLGSRIVVAGGGGGAGYSADGGAAGQAGGTASSCSPGTAGTAVAGGSIGGTLGQGGASGDGSNGGGGGGGLWGGGAASADVGGCGGGGGSSGSATGAAVSVGADTSGSPKVTLTYTPGAVTTTGTNGTTTATTTVPVTTTTTTPTVATAPALRGLSVASGQRGTQLVATAQIGYNRSTIRARLLFRRSKLAKPTTVGTRFLPASAGLRSFTIKLNRTGRKLLKARRKLALQLVVTVTPPVGTIVTLKRKVTLRR